MIEFLELALFKVSRFSWMEPGSDSLLVLLGVSGDKLFMSSVVLGLSAWEYPPRACEPVVEIGGGAVDNNDRLLNEDP